MFHIRPAIPSDFPAVGRLYDQVGALHSRNLPEIFRDGGESVFPYDTLAQALETGAAEILVAEMGGEITGFVTVLLRDTPDLPVLQPRRLGVIDALGVAPQARGKGIGRALMEAAQEWARGKGALTVELNVYEFNAQARGLYEKMGYKTLSRKMSLKL